MSVVKGEKFAMSVVEGEKFVVMMTILGRLVDIVPGASDDPLIKLCGEALDDKPGAFEMLVRLAEHHELQSNAERIEASS